MSGKESGGIGSLGELLVEFVCTEKDGHNRRAAPYVGPFASGAPGIFIDQAARVGARAIFAGAVGDDAFGSVLRQRLTEVGVSDKLIATVPGIPTGSAFVSYNTDGSRDFVFNIAHSAASHFPRDSKALETLKQFGLAAFHISGSTLGNPAMAKAALVICRALHDAGVAISFDPNIRKELLADPSYMETVRSLLAISAFVLPSAEDFEVLFPGEEFGTFSRRFLDGRARFVILKRGEKGCVGMDASGVVEEFDAHKVEVVDPTGAGDCFCATFVALVTSGNFSFREALRRANAAGALAVGKIGPMEGNSSLAEIEAFLGCRA
ncbi:sugar kinase [Mesorhizobium sp. CN2-181]|uniref:carbohydrate kinase family protein n=1 Tax=Mesorhizobium yinganensis TaxID=3157707 RepID=UPI0032B72CE5